MTRKTETTANLVLVQPAWIPVSLLEERDERERLIFIVISRIETITIMVSARVAAPLRRMDSTAIRIQSAPVGIARRDQAGLVHIIGGRSRL